MERGRTDEEARMKIHTYFGKEARWALTDRWGLPNAAPRPGELPWATNRVVFVDDSRDGLPVAYWESEEEAKMQPETTDWQINCPAPFRKGRHEIYRTLAGGPYCRACGAGAPKEEPLGGRGYTYEECARAYADDPTFHAVVDTLVGLMEQL